MAYGLTRKIFKHALAEKWIKAGDVVVDPFGGISSTAIIGAYLGIKVITCELEPKFTHFAMQNIMLHKPKWDGLNCPCPDIIQGDSRNLTEILSCLKEASVLNLQEKEIQTGKGEVFGGEEQHGQDKNGLQKKETNTNALDVEVKNHTCESIIKKAQKKEKNGTIPSTISKPCAIPVMQNLTISEANKNAKLPAESAEQNLLQEQEMQTYALLSADGQDGEKKTNKENSLKFKPGSIDAVISSPPYATGSIAKNSSGIDRKKQWETYRSQGGGLSYQAFCEQQERHSSEYGNSPGQLQNLKPGNIDMVISSPPHLNSLSSESEDQTKRKQERIAKSKTIHDGRKLEKPSPGKAGLGGGYGSTPGNLGNLKPGQVDAIVSSPPYEGNPGSKEELGGQVQNYDVRKNPRYPGEKLYFTKYEKQKAEGNLGNEQGETFWQAARQIVSECHKILKPGGHAIWVVKSFVRNKKIVDFPGDWRRLCESLGFETVHEHHAMLVKEERKPSLFGHEIVKVKERKSFFRRLAEQKGSPKIDYEVVLCMRKGKDANKDMHKMRQGKTA